MPHRDMARVLPSKFDPGLGLHAAPERMFHQSNLSHQVGYLDECIGCVPASHAHMGHGGLCSASCTHYVARPIVVAKDDVEFHGYAHIYAERSQHPIHLHTTPPSLQKYP